MKTELEQLYGEYMQLWEQSHDYLIKAKYLEKMQAIEIILKPMPYKAENPVLSLLQEQKEEKEECDCENYAEYDNGIKWCSVCSKRLD